MVKGTGGASSEVDERDFFAFLLCEGQRTHVGIVLGEHVCFCLVGGDSLPFVAECLIRGGTGGRAVKGLDDPLNPVHVFVRFEGLHKIRPGFQLGFFLSQPEFFARFNPFAPLRFHLSPQRVSDPDQTLDVEVK